MAKLVEVGEDLYVRPDRVEAVRFHYKKEPDEGVMRVSLKMMGDDIFMNTYTVLTKDTFVASLNNLSKDPE